MMRKLRRFAITVLFWMSASIFAPIASAHPLGNFTTNHYAGLHVKKDGIAVDYVLDMAEIPAFQEIDAIDANRNGQPDPGESAGYHLAQCEKIRVDLDLKANDRQLPLRLVSSAIAFPPGQGGLLTLRLNCLFGAAISSGMRVMRVEFEDRSFQNRMGWREIVVTGEGVLLQGEFSTDSLSRRLTEYPQDLLSSPLDLRQVSFQATVSSPSTLEKQAVSYEALQPAKADKNDAFTRLILMENTTLPAVLIALVVACIWGAMHALTPGHGKTIVGAYLVGARGTARHAIYLGLTTTITHTAGVFVLGLVTMFAARYILPDKLFPWLSFASGLLVVGIGANLFLGRLRATGILTRISAVKNAGPHGHHSHGPNTHDHHHDHDHVHSHEHPASHHHGGGHDHNHMHDSHLPPGADGTPVSWRSLLALGISGGLLPCPSALVVLLSAIALNRVGFGLVLVFAFSLGLASVLSGIGLLFVFASRFFNRIPVRSRALSLLPALSALFITLVGLGISARALVEMGYINL